MILFTIETPEISATAYYLPNNRPLYARPYRIDVTDKATGKCEVREANNTYIIARFLPGLNYRILELEQEARMRSQGYERKTPYARWEKVRK